MRRDIIFLTFKLHRLSKYMCKLSICLLYISKASTSTLDFLWVDCPNCDLSCLHPMPLVTHTTTEGDTLLRPLSSKFLKAIPILLKNRFNFFMSILISLQILNCFYFISVTLSHHYAVSMRTDCTMLALHFLRQVRLDRRFSIR